MRQHTPAYISIRQHTSAYVSIRAARTMLTNTSAMSYADVYAVCRRMLTYAYTSAYVGIRATSAAVLHACTPLHAQRARALVIRKHTSAYVQHTCAHVSIRACGGVSAYVSIRQHTSAYASIRQHTSAYVSIRQHTSAYVSIRACGGAACVRIFALAICASTPRTNTCFRPQATLPAYVSLRQPTSAYVSLRQPTSAYVSLRQPTSAYVSMRQHTSAYVSLRQHTRAHLTELPQPRHHRPPRHEPRSIRQHMSAYVSIRQRMLRGYCEHTLQYSASPSINDPASTNPALTAAAIPRD
jgi:hypothetical protein